MTNKISFSFKVWGVDPPKEYIQACYLMTKRNDIFYNKPVLILVKAFYKIPDYVPKPKRILYKKGLYLCSKGNAPLLAQRIGEALEGVAYENINAVVNIVVDKSWTEETEYTEIELTTGVGEMAKERKSMEIYCVKCKQKRDVADYKAITMKNGKPAVQGVCPICGTKVFKIGKA